MRWILTILIFGLGLTAGFEVGTQYAGVDWISHIKNIPKALGASSWVHVLYWIGGAVIALAAVAGLDQRNRQAKAEFLLRLYEQWEEIGQSREAFYNHYGKGRDLIKDNHKALSDNARIPKMRQYFEEMVANIHDTKDTAKTFEQFIQFLTFFETVGHFVKRRYISFSDVLELFKGTILCADIMFCDYIEKRWQKRFGMAPGLLSNALYLFRRTRRREKIVKTLALWRNWSQ